MLFSFSLRKTLFIGCVICHHLFDQCFVIISYSISSFTIVIFAVSRPTGCWYEDEIVDSSTDYIKSSLKKGNSNHVVDTSNCIFIYKWPNINPYNLLRVNHGVGVQLKDESHAVN